MTRQNFYKVRRDRKRREIDADLVVDLVKAERQVQPRLGGRKLYKMLKQPLEEAGVSLGRDAMFDVLRDQGLLLKPQRSRPRTTDSRHSLPVFGNQIADLTISRPNEVWVADITYIRTNQGFVYLALVMDLFSRRVMGYDCGDSLEASGALRALGRALKKLPLGRHPIHHSDRGSQYCSHRYIDHLKSHNLSVSMTEELHCYENAHAERLNGILKQEYALGSTFRSKEQAYRAVDQAVQLYNTRRPHASLQYNVPSAVYEAAA